MKVIQGRYVEKIESGKGKLKGLRVATSQGDETGYLSVYLPKALRAIALKELTLDQPVRIWLERDRKLSKQASKEKLYALQLIPLSPKAAIDVELEVDKKLEKKAEKKKGREKTKAKKSKVTVQICQKKNCCKKGGDDLWEAFESASERHQFKLEPIGCLGGCKRGPNIRLLPDNVKYRHVQPAEIDSILQTHI